MKETLENLRNYANASDNWWLETKLHQLETEIKIAVTEGKIEVYNEIAKQNDELFKK